MSEWFEVGEGFAGDGANAAHINTVLGEKSGPVGGAFVTTLGSPKVGHIPFLVVWKPNVPVTPATLFVNKAAIANDRHGELTWGAAQAGVAHGSPNMPQHDLLKLVKVMHLSCSQRCG